MILSLHPTGNAVVRQQIRAFEEAGWLEEFWTCLSWREKSIWSRCVPDALSTQLRRRNFPMSDPERLRLHPWREAGRLLASRAGWNDAIRHESGFFSVDQVYHSLSRRVARRLDTVRNVSVLFAPEDGALELFSAARESMTRVYELPTGYWKLGQELYREETERWPEWRTTMRGHQDSPQKLERKDRELELSDVVLVASRFTESTLRLGPKIKAQTIRIPFGCSSERMPREKIPAGGPLRVLFVGALDQRKGLTYLFDAVEGAEKWLSLTVIGTRPHEACAVLDRKLQNHRWISTLPHARVLEEMSRHDVLVFPSLFEGFGLVIVEALSQGLPVITTDHTAGPDVITDGREGFIVPIRDVRSIREKLEWLAADASRLESMREAAYARAAQLEWTHYRSLLRQHLQPYIRKS